MDSLRRCGFALALMSLVGCAPAQWQRVEAMQSRATGCWREYETQVVSLAPGAFYTCGCGYRAFYECDRSSGVCRRTDGVPAGVPVREPFRQIAGQALSWAERQELTDVLDGAAVRLVTRRGLEENERVDVRIGVDGRLLDADEYLHSGLGRHFQFERWSHPVELEWDIAASLVAAVRAGARVASVDPSPSHAALRAAGGSPTPGDVGAVARVTE